MSTDFSLEKNGEGRERKKAEKAAGHLIYENLN